MNSHIAIYLTLLTKLQSDSNSLARKCVDEIRNLAHKHIFFLLCLAEDPAATSVALTVKCVQMISRYVSFYWCATKFVRWWAKFYLIYTNIKSHPRKGGTVVRFSNVSKVHCILVIVLPCQLNEEPLAMSQESPSQELLPLKKRRTRIPDKPNYSLNLWSIMKNCIGKELSKIPMPVSPCS